MTKNAISVVGVIPAHLESRRLPRKVLRPICGQAMLAWVYERAKQSPHLDRLLVATDAEEIFSYCQKRAIPVVMTSKDHHSGTERVMEVLRRDPAEVCVNIQGDEPMIMPDHVELLLQPFWADPETQVSTLKVAVPAEEAQDPNNVKVVTDAEGRALYFSRAPIPYDTHKSGRARYYKHAGLYAYSFAALEKFCSLPPSSLELQEKLEQLRFLENGIPIKVVETLENSIGVDTEEDLKKVEAYFQQLGVGHPAAKEAG